MSAANTRSARVSRRLTLFAFSPPPPSDCMPESVLLCQTASNPVVSFSRRCSSHCIASQKGAIAPRRSAHSLHAALPICRAMTELIPPCTTQRNGQSLSRQDGSTRSHSAISSHGCASAALAHNEEHVDEKWESSQQQLTSGDQLALVDLSGAPDF